MLLGKLPNFTAISTDNAFSLIYDIQKSILFLIFDKIPL